MISYRAASTAVTVSSLNINSDCLTTGDGSFRTRCGIAYLPATTVQQLHTDNNNHNHNNNWPACTSSILLPYKPEVPGITGHINHWQTQRIHLSISAVVNSPPKGKRGRLPQRFWLRLDAIAVIPCLVQCLENAVLASGQKKQKQKIIINRRFQTHRNSNFQIMSSQTSICVRFMNWVCWSFSLFCEPIAYYSLL